MEWQMLTTSTADEAVKAFSDFLLGRGFEVETWTTQNPQWQNEDQYLHAAPVREGGVRREDRSLMELHEGWIVIGDTGLKIPLYSEATGFTWWWLIDSDNVLHIRFYNNNERPELRLNASYRVARLQ